MATWVALIKVHVGDTDPPQWWAAMFERGSLEGIKLRELRLDEAAFAPFRGEVIEGAIEGGLEWDRLLRAMTAAPLAWFQL